jgi:hypothetical protein
MKHSQFFESKRNWKSVVEGNFYQQFSIPMRTNSRETQPKGDLEFTMVSLREIIGKGSGAKDASKRRSFR